MIRGALTGVVEREFKRVVRQRGRLASTFTRPLIWLIIIGSGFSPLIPGGEFSYRKFLLPGIVGMILLFSSLLSALGSIHDREFGSMRMLMIAPVPRWVIVLGKTISATLVGFVFALILSPLAFLFEVEVGFLSYLGFLGAVLLTAFALSSLGMLIASRLRALENFAVAMNFVIFPMFFLSGALYPVEDLPSYLQPLVRVNPLTYGVDLMRHTLLAAETQAASHIEFTPGADVGFLVAFSILALLVAVPLFSRDEHLSLMFLSRAPRPVPLMKQVAMMTRRLLARPAGAVASARASGASASAAALPNSHGPPALAGAGPAAASPHGPAPPGVRPAWPPSREIGPVQTPLGAALLGVMGREFKRVLRQRGRLASTFARPLLWLVVVGGAFAALIPGGQYHKYLFPGIIGMSILFSTLLSGLASVHDREFGPMRMLMVAPIPRGVVVLGKMLSGAILAAVFAIVLLPLALAFNIEVTLESALETVGAVLLTSLSLSALGMLLAAGVRRLENFTVAMNFVIFPLFFFSGALYPAENLPGFLQPIVLANPLTYGVDLMRHAMLINEPHAVNPIEFTPAADIGFLVAFMFLALTLAVRWFDREEHLSLMFLAAGPRRVSFLKKLPRGRPKPPLKRPLKA